MYNTNNTIKVLIGKDVDWDATTIDTMVVGEVAVLGPEDQVLAIDSTTATPEYFTILQKSNDGTIHSSQRVKTRNVIKLSKATYSAPREQVDVIGYNAVTGTGSIEEIDNNTYMVNLSFKHDKGVWSEQLLKRLYSYTSGNGATQKNIARYISAAINADGMGFLSAVIKTQLATETAVGGGVTHTTVNGSTTVITNLAHGLAIGDVVRLAGSGTGVPVYIVVSVPSATSFELHTPYQDVSIAGGTIRVITANTSYGVEITGVALAYKDNGLYTWNKVMWDTALMNFGTTPYLTRQTMSLGEGTPQQVRDLEWFSVAGDGAFNTLVHPINEGRNDTDMTKTYDVLSVEYFNDDDMYPVSGTKPSRGLIYIFRDHNVTGGTVFTLLSVGGTSSLEDALEAWTGKTAV